MRQDEQLEIKTFFQEEKPEYILEQMKPFKQLMMQYECALKEVETKLNVLNAEFSLEYDRNPFESIKTRIKQPMSIWGKLRRNGEELTVENIENCLSDVAGIRVICSFPEDIYTIAELLSKQDDISVLRRKDYIKHPKENGYRSLHLILEIPIFLSEEKKYMKVEVQFRTIAMDFWASVEHKLKYKKNIKEPEKIAEQLKHCAETIADVDFRMQAIRHEIDRDAEQEEDDEV
ncbi:MAG: GTP pyrophosphokinase family protein [Lachnospiraceae bacterium]|nr:GTP pyrophosphokinase family protein [Lachnospiraceae bacterium]